MASIWELWLLLTLLASPQLKAPSKIFPQAVMKIPLFCVCLTSSSTSILARIVSLLDESSRPPSPSVVVDSGVVEAAVLLRRSSSVLRLVVWRVCRDSTVVAGFLVVLSLTLVLSAAVVVWISSASVEVRAPPRSGMFPLVVVIIMSSCDVDAGTEVAVVVVPLN